VSQQNRILIGFLILIIILGVFFGLDLAQYWKVTAAQEIPSNIPDGGIPIYLDGDLAATFTPNDLVHLRMESFVEAEQGKTEEGWLLRDVLILHVNEELLLPDSIIIVSSTSREKSARLSWGEVREVENMVLFDLSGRGTLKLVSRLDKLDIRDEWVQDVEKIEIETR
jgi:hypothetical protein